ncbi:hypothetical protein ACFSQ3_09015 [Sphingobacterium corticis]|uniref:Response regulatory domain-containing protein n=1 Tax=Sphingobacterium corticis TaxID=1812823 RepID=A0ABW5NMA6_9SPHI
MDILIVDLSSIARFGLTLAISHINKLANFDEADSFQQCTGLIALKPYDFVFLNPNIFPTQSIDFLAKIKQIEPQVNLVIIKDDRTCQEFVHRSKFYSKHNIELVQALDLCSEALERILHSIDH